MTEQWRVACVRIPRFPIAAVWRARPVPARPSRPLLPPLKPSPPRLHAVDAAPPPWDDALLALTEGARLRAISGAAARAGVRSGMTVLEARARCAALTVLEWDDGAIAAAIAAFSAQLLAASPQVTPAAHEPGLWWVGAHGLEAMGGERMLVRALAELAHAWHPRARVAVASSCVAARAAN
jgi:hypothetical protein